MCIYSPMPHTLPYGALIGKCALIRSNTVVKQSFRKDVPANCSFDHFEFEFRIFIAVAFKGCSP